MLTDPKALEYCVTIIKEFGASNIAITASDLLDRMRSQMHQTEQSNLPESYIRKVLSRMSALRLLTSSLDGYRLAKPYQEYTILDVILICQQQRSSNPLVDEVTAKLKELAATIKLEEVIH